MPAPGEELLELGEQRVGIAEPRDIGGEPLDRPPLSPVRVHDRGQLGKFELGVRDQLWGIAVSKSEACRAGGRTNR